MTFLISESTLTDNDDDDNNNADKLWLYSFILALCQMSQK